ncbi:hypothetical protein WICPIJ_003105 [Wickerhamomyces pijperi]|uniref:EF-hand domain-containing protein n=1 Tax=Wickerhamomyces pijperi TaxID=599730 RepID=A0A9P8Q8I1_WICPI|nr:hypothetical protein WICPIJ_003105 [Wickerhamomyces pijperi]
MSEVTQLSSDQINKLRTSFQLIDQDNDGKISISDLNKIHESLGITLSQTQIDEMLTAGNDGMITFPNYLSIISNDMKTIPDSNELKQALQIFSLDMNINIKELRESLLKQGGISEKDIDSVINRFKLEKMSGEEVFKGKEFWEFLTK